MNNDIIAYSTTGIEYTKTDLMKYAYVICHECGVKLHGDKNNDGIVRISCICVDCYPDFKKNKKNEKSETIRKYQQNNKERQRQMQLERRIKNKMLVFNHYSNGVPRCACCNESDDRFLTVDHINNDGAEHRKSVSNIYSWLVRNGFPDGFQILCYNCNCAKGIYGECPHKIPIDDNGMIDDELFINLGNA